MHPLHTHHLSNLQPPKHAIQFLALPHLLCLRLPLLRIIIHDILHNPLVLLLLLLRLQNMHPTIQPPRRKSPLLRQILCRPLILPPFERASRVGF
jgi:hypothetical protein